MTEDWCAKARFGRNQDRLVATVVCWPPVLATRSNPVRLRTRPAPDAADSTDGTKRSFVCDRASVTGLHRFQQLDPISKGVVRVNSPDAGQIDVFAERDVPRFEHRESPLK